MQEIAKELLQIKHHNKEFQTCLKKQQEFYQEIYHPDFTFLEAGALSDEYFTIKISFIKVCDILSQAFFINFYLSLFL